MDIARFQQIADHMLAKHYGITLNDTPLAEREYVATCITAGEQPYQALNAQAAECDLFRIDKDGIYGTPDYTELTDQDELAALQALNLKG